MKPLLPLLGSVVTLVSACGGDSGTSPSDLARFEGAYTLVVGPHSFAVESSEYEDGGQREVIMVSGGSAADCAVRVDFAYAKRGRPATEVTDASLLGFGGPECTFFGARLVIPQGVSAPRVVARSGRNEIDDGILSGSMGFPATQVDVRWSLRAR